ncbi:phage portal protein [Streptomyces sp. MJM8645]|uniref:phage portal protein n=1 Tax=Streptomycetaceae TaxID=2062 RepID=UPI0007AEEAD7|nr:phage portal protein [Streptomyces sp. MJM8645]
MGWRLAPGLRRLVTRPAPTEMESKGWNGSWASLPGITAEYGTEGRADGWDLERVISEGYEQGVWVFKSVETISGHQARRPFSIGRGEKPGEHSEILSDHPLYRVLNGQANPLETGRVFRKRLSAQVLLSKKGAFVEVTKSRLGTITRLDLLPPDRVRPVPDPSGDYLSHFEFTTRTGRLRELAPERVRWVRDPHPTDPFSGITPLEAAGISIDLDHLARLYNVSFLRRDGRPGGIVGVDLKGATERQLDRIEARFSPGVDHAGQLAVIGTGPGGVQFIDTSTRPRDMAYKELAGTSKDEILAAFGVSEAMFGSTAGKTYANAEQDEFTFWTITAIPHLDVIASAFLPDIDVDEGWRPYIDTSDVEVLDLPRRERLKVLREEWTAGLISADEYRQAAGRDTIDNPQTRALWFSPQKAPVPARPEDAAELGIGGGQVAGDPAGLVGAAQTNGQPPSGQDGAAAAAAVAEARGADDQDPAGGGAAADAVGAARGPARPVPGVAAAEAVAQVRGVGGISTAGAAAAAVDRVRAAADRGPGPGPAAVAVAAAQEVKTLPVSGATPAVAGWEVPEAEEERLRGAASAALDALLARQAEVIAARLRSPKLRSRTRYWQPGPYEVDTRSGDTPIDAAKAVVPDRWVEESVATLEPLVALTVQATAAECIAALTGVAANSAVLGAAAGGLHAATLDAVTLGAASIRAFLADVADAITAVQNDQPGLTLEQLVGHTRGLFADNARRLADDAARSIAAAAVNGAAEASAAACGPQVTRTWMSRGDERVRPAHQELDGQTLPVLEAFSADGYPLRYPGDPIAPPALIRNCRCRLRYQAEPLLTDGGDPDVR